MLSIPCSLLAIYGVMHVALWIVCSLLIAKLSNVLRDAEDWILVTVDNHRTQCGCVGLQRSVHRSASDVNKTIPYHVVLFHFTASAHATGVTAELDFLFKASKVSPFLKAQPYDNGPG